jgi:hypothetical protein
VKASRIVTFLARVLGVQSPLDDVAVAAAGFVKIQMGGEGDSHVLPLTRADFLCGLGGQAQVHGKWLTQAVYGDGLIEISAHLLEIRAALDNERQRFGQIEYGKIFRLWSLKDRPQPPPASE